MTITSNTNSCPEYSREAHQQHFVSGAFMTSYTGIIITSSLPQTHELRKSPSPSLGHRRVYETQERKEENNTAPCKDGALSFEIFEDREMRAPSLLLLHENSIDARLFSPLHFQLFLTHCIYNSNLESKSFCAPLSFMIIIMVSSCQIPLVIIKGEV